MKIGTGATIGALLALSGCGEPMTRGDIRDMETANDVERCAHQHLGKPNSSADTEIWITCLRVSSELDQRDKIRVARRVVEKQGKNVFEDSASLDLSPSLIARIKRGS
jgi:hypothetical protein